MVKDIKGLVELLRGLQIHLTQKATSGRKSLAFRFIPQSNAILDCSPIIAVGHFIP